MFNIEDKTNYLRLLRYLIPLKKVAIAALLTTIVYGATEPIMPWIMKGLIDDGFSASGSERFNTIVYFIFLMIIGFLIRGTANFSSSYATTWVGQKIIYTLRSEMFYKMHQLPMHYFSNHSQGSVMSKFTYDVTQLMSATTSTLITLLRDCVTISALIASLFILDWRMTLVLMLATPFVAIFIVYVSRKLRRLSQSLQADMGNINHVIDESLRGRAIVRIYNGYKHEYERFDKQASSVEHHILASTRVGAITSPILEIIIVIALSAVILIAGLQTQAQGMTNGKFIAFLGTMALIFPPVKRIGKANEPIQRGLAAMQSIFNFLDQPTEAQLPPQDIKIKHGAIRFENITFQYDDQPVLEDFNLTINTGETIALVGESGSGKSTLAALLAGFYSPDKGTIYFDNYDGSKISLAQRRQAMAYVSQDTVLFSATVAENIAYADENADRTQVIAAAKSANADEFIQTLENGYDTHIGEHGSRLSGGQKQRIAIARALYKNAPILILDEATSALDNRSEKKVQEAVEKLRKNRTAIIIAHRLSTIKNADRIVVLNKGRIAESGNHESLIKQNGFYAKLLLRLPE